MAGSRLKRFSEWLQMVIDGTTRKMVKSFKNGGFWGVRPPCACKASMKRVQFTLHEKIMIYFRYLNHSKRLGTLREWYFFSICPKYGYLFVYLSLSRNYYRLRGRGGEKNVEKNSFEGYGTYIEVIYEDSGNFLPQTCNTILKQYGIAETAKKNKN